MMRYIRITIFLQLIPFETILENNFTEGFSMTIYVTLAALTITVLRLIDPVIYSELLRVVLQIYNLIKTKSCQLSIKQSNFVNNLTNDDNDSFLNLLHK